MRYLVTSCDCKASYHRKLSNAFHEACQRLNIGDTEIQISDWRTSRAINITAESTISAVEGWLTYGDQPKGAKQ